MARASQDTSPFFLAAIYSAADQRASCRSRAVESRGRPDQRGGKASRNHCATAGGARPRGGKLLESRGARTG